MLSPSINPSIVIMASFPTFHYFNKLPADVKRLIFEEAFEASGWNAVELASVSREARVW